MQDNPMHDNSSVFTWHTIAVHDKCSLYTYNSAAVHDKYSLFTCHSVAVCEVKWKVQHVTNNA